jgi:hypothetical protein
LRTPGFELPCGFQRENQSPTALAWRVLNATAINRRIAKRRAGGAEKSTSQTTNKNTHVQQ